MENFKNLYAEKLKSLGWKIVKLERYTGLDIYSVELKHDLDKTGKYHFFAEFAEEDDIYQKINSDIQEMFEDGYQFPQDAKMMSAMQNLLAAF